MRKILFLVFVGFIVFLYLNKQRVFLRDPLAAVVRGGVLQHGTAKVLINASNDILLEDSSDSKQRTYIVQRWNKVAGTPTIPLKCVQGVACMTDADQATAAPVSTVAATMTDKQVDFVDEDGVKLQVSLR